MTLEWLEENFDGQEFNDTVFVSGNPNLANIDASFADVVPIWEVNWDEQAGTARPEAMVKETIKAHSEYPNKRLISWFVQPHAPFLGPTGKEIMQQGFTGGGIIGDRKIEPIWERLRRGKLDSEVVFKAYKENFELTLPHLKSVLSELDGKTIISSDHGNAFGEHGIWGHPRSVHSPELISVPWLTVDYDERQDIEPVAEQDLVSTTMSDDEIIQRRLSDLGYR
jgi:hypothetical protein